MDGNPIAKLELDCFQMSEMLECMEFAAKHNLPAVVVHQGLSSDALILRNKVRGKFKVVVPIDWPKGDHFGNLKFRGLTIDSLEGDAFEIVMSPGKSIIEMKNEARVCTDFIRTYLGSTQEIRFVIPTNKTDVAAIGELAGLFTGIRNPAFVRFGFAHKAPVHKINRVYNTEIRKKLFEAVGSPIKMCGNIQTIEDVDSIGAARYGVSLAFAKAIVNQYLTAQEERHSTPVA
jgi:hypothetical protein